MEKILCAVIITIGIAFSGCGKDNAKNHTHDASGTTGETAATAIPPENGYFPLTIGSEWKHIYSDYGPPGIETRVFGDTTIKGVHYAWISETLHGENPIQARDCYRRSHDTVFAIMNGDSTESIALIEKVGATWTYTVGEGNNKFKQSFKAVEIQPLRTVQGKDYEDVLHIHRSTAAQTGETPLYEEDMYYARNTGLIEEKLTMDQTVRLVEYSIK